MIHGVGKDGIFNSGPSGKIDDFVIVKIGDNIQVIK